MYVVMPQDSFVDNYTVLDTCRTHLGDTVLLHRRLIADDRFQELEGVATLVDNIPTN